MRTCSVSDSQKIIITELTGLLNALAFDESQFWFHDE